MEIRDRNGLTEAEYLKKYKEKNYPKPSLTADVVLFGDDRTRLLLIQRGGHPFLGQWAFPGGFAEESETVEMSALRELEEETGLTGIPVHLTGVFSRPGRDPRGWTVSAAFFADVAVKDCRAAAGDDAAAAEWFYLKYDEKTVTLTGKDTGIRFRYESGGSGVRIEFLTETILAFDHAEILVRSLEKAL